MSLYARRFVAGEYDGAAIYVIEHFGKKAHYTASAITRSTGVLGMLIGIGATNFFNSHIFPEWGWRIPYLLSLPLAAVTLYYRRRLAETPEFEEIQAKTISMKKLSDLIRHQWQLILMVVFLAGGFGITYQISIIFMKQYLPIILPSSQLIISSFSVLLVLTFGLAMPISGLAADRLGKMKIVKFSLFATFISSGLLIIAVESQTLNLGLTACLSLAISVAPFNALAHGVVVKAFPVSERYRGISLGHTIGSMLMSGSANLICSIFMKSFNLYLFPIIYVCIGAVLCYLMIRSLEKNCIA